MAVDVPKDYWAFFASEALRGHSPLYQRLALGVRETPELQALAAHARKGQPHANILFGAVHYLLLGGLSDALADYYPSVRPAARPQGDVFPLFAAFCKANERDLLPLIKTRVTNTNEVARSATLYPAFDFIARETGEALHLIEIGPSAGLNMNWDRYLYSYMRDGRVAIERGAHGSKVHLTPELRSAAVPPLLARMPEVANRVGLELNPVDLSKPEDRLWLKALIWPELTARFARFDGAMEVALAHPQRIWPGDALALLPDAVTRELPPNGAAVVYHSHVTYQFSEEMRARLNELLMTLSCKRPIYRLSIEWDGADYPINLGRYDGGEPTRRTLGHCDPHGSWLGWTA